MGFGYLRELGDVTVIEMQSRAPIVRGGHVHSCPECYEDVPCEHTCSCEEDLRLDDGTPRGAYVVCDRCAAATGAGR